MNICDYVKYDETSAVKQERGKQICESLAQFIGSLGQGRPQSLAITKLEECYMWIGKAIRDDQVKRGGDIADQEKRSDG